MIVARQLAPASKCRPNHISQPNHVIAVASGKGRGWQINNLDQSGLGLAATGKKVGILDADIYGPSLPRLIGLNRKPQSDGKKIVPIEAWGLQTMSIGYLVAEDAPTIWRGPMVMSAIEQMLRDVAWDAAGYSGH
jgi:ATP-binding protein involved in chromosome partitioning